MFEPMEIIILGIRLQLVCARRDVKAIDDPRIIALQFKHPCPGRIGFHRKRFFMWLKVDEPAPPGIVRERAPLARNQWRMIAVLARSDDARMLVERKRNFRFQRQARAFENNFRCEFAHIIQNTNARPSTEPGRAFFVRLFLAQNLFKLFVHHRHDLKQIADDAVIGNLEDGRVRVFVDGDDDLGR